MNFFVWFLILWNNCFKVGEPWARSKCGNCSEVSAWPTLLVLSSYRHSYSHLCVQTCGPIHNFFINWEIHSRVCSIIPICFSLIYLMSPLLSQITCARYSNNAHVSTFKTLMLQLDWGNGKGWNIVYVKPLWRINHSHRWNNIFFFFLFFFESMWEVEWNPPGVKYKEKINHSTCASGLLSKLIINTLISFHFLNPNPTLVFSSSWYNWSLEPDIQLVVLVENMKSNCLIYIYVSLMHAYLTDIGVVIVGETAHLPRHQIHGVP